MLDLAGTLPLAESVAAGDSALRKNLVTLGQVRALATATRGRGRTQALATTALLDPKSGSILESLLRVLLLTAGLPAPVTQAYITDGDCVVARVDFCWRSQRLIVEADGFAYHSDRLAYRRDRERMNELEQLGWRVLRFHLGGRGWAAALRRRPGTTLPRACGVTRGKAVDGAPSVRGPASGGGGLPWRFSALSSSPG